MKEIKILTLSTYPVKQPAHGGQHRLHNIIQNYAMQGHDVQAVGVLGSESYSPEDGFVPFPGIDALSAYIENPFLMEDWAIGRLFGENDYFFESLAKEIRFRPDVIHVEQPWLFAFALRFNQKLLGGGARLVYGSANIEHELKSSIIKKYMGSVVAAACASKVLDIEIAALRDADLVACVSESDLLWSKAHARAECLLAANGVADRQVTRDGIKEANKISGHHKFALYCASGHPPNISGFFDFFGDGVGCIAPDQCLVVAGSAGPAILQDERAKRAAGLNRLIRSNGTVTEDCLQGLLHTSHAIILPITEGGGTNLKTAEALWAGKRIVGTPTAFRGFERFMDAPGVSIAEQRANFLQELQKAMTAHALVLDQEEKESRKSVLWGHSLKALVSAVNSL